MRLTETNADSVRVDVVVWLPQTWNGRFQGVGGGGYACGPAYLNLAAAIRAGYASGSTNCGIVPVDVPSAVGLTGPWALNADGTLNWPLIRTFAATGIHDMTVIGKAVTGSFYGAPSQYNYFVGCSGGGREALMEAQRFPADYDGIVSGAPTTNWAQLSTSLIWAQLVMNESNDFLPACKQAAFTAAAVSACDGADGVVDGVIGDPRSCTWRPSRLVGTVTPCGTITATDAAVVAKIWQGPTSATGQRPLWYGTLPGAALDALGMTTTVNGVTTGVPFAKALSWTGTWLLRNPSWDWKTLTYEQFDRLFARAEAEFAPVLNTDDPDLTAFAGRGGKLLLWDGWSDQYLFPQGTLHYYTSVKTRMGPAADDSVRFFMAPGVGHCNIGNVGPALVDPLGVVRAWTEGGAAPESIVATKSDASGTVTLSRPVCAYPLVARYQGPNPNDANSFACATNFGPPA